MGVIDIQWNTKKRSIMVRGVVVALTVTEYRLLYLLRCGTAVTYSDLALLIYGCELDKRVLAMLDKHVDRIRRKLRKTDFYIYCVLGYGYLLWPRSAGDSPLHSPGGNHTVETCL